MFLLAESWEGREHPLQETGAIVVFVSSHTAKPLLRKAPFFSRGPLILSQTYPFKHMQSESPLPTGVKCQQEDLEGHAQM